MGCIYVLKNKVNGKMYVGQTAQRNDSKHRIRDHIGQKTLIGKSIKKNGIENYNIFNYIIPNEYLDVFEKDLIIKLNTIYPNGYNLDGGGNKQKYRSAEVRKNISNAKKGKPYNISKEVLKKRNSKIAEKNKGRKYNKETLKKMSESAKKTYYNGRVNPMFGKHRDSPSSIKIICVETGIIYKSIRDAAKSFNTKNDTAIRNCLRDPFKTYKGFHFKHYKEKS